MDQQSLFDKYKPLLKQNWIPIILGFLGVIFFAYGLIYLLTSNNSSSDIVLETGNQATESAKPVATGKEIYADIEGAVAKPGVYKLPQDSRIQDVLIAAGGLSSEADRSWVAKNLNLALRLNDGAKIYVPKTGEASSVLLKNSGSTGNTGSVGASGGTDLVNINTASESELDALSGIGPVTAQKIIDNRPYNSIEEMVSKKAVTQKVFDKIKEKLTIY